MKSNKRKNELEEVSFWQSYSDMMAALLLVFVLIISATLVSGKLAIKNKEDELIQQGELLLKMQVDLDQSRADLDQSRADMDEAQIALDKSKADMEEAQSALEATAEELDQKESEFNLAQIVLAAQKEDLNRLQEEVALKEQENEEAKKTLEQTKANLEKLQGELALKEEEIEGFHVQLDNVVGVRAEVIKKLSDAFANSSIPVTVNDETGAITFESGVMFPTNSSTLSQEGKEFLDEFFPKYFEVMFNDDVKDYISEVIIEGHTDDVGTYLENLKLSQDRAYEVANYCLGNESNMFDDETLENVKHIITANGRSFMEPKLNQKGEIDRDASRRVEVKFRLTEQQMIEDISSIMEN